MLCDKFEFLKAICSLVEIRWHKTISLNFLNGNTNYVTKVMILINKSFSEFRLQALCI